MHLAAIYKMAQDEVDELQLSLRQQQRLELLISTRGDVDKKFELETAMEVEAVSRAAMWTEKWSKHLLEQKSADRVKRKSNNSKRLPKNDLEMVLLF